MLWQELLSWQESLLRELGLWLLQHSLLSNSWCLLSPVLTEWHWPQGLRCSHLAQVLHLQSWSVEWWLVVPKQGVVVMQCQQIVSVRVLVSWALPVDGVMPLSHQLRVLFSQLSVPHLSHPQTLHLCLPQLHEMTVHTCHKYDFSVVLWLPSM